eukprot:g11817.t2
MACAEVQVIYVPEELPEELVKHLSDHWDTMLYRVQPLHESLPKDLHLDTGTGSYCGSSVCSYSSSDEAEGSEGEAAASPDPAELPGTPEPELVPMPRWVEGSRTISTPDLESLPGSLMKCGAWPMKRGSNWWEKPWSLIVTVVFLEGM